MIKKYTILFITTVAAIGLLFEIVESNQQQNKDVISELKVSSIRLPAIITIDSSQPTIITNRKIIKSTVYKDNKSNIQKYSSPIVCYYENSIWGYSVSFFSNLYF